MQRVRELVLLAVWQASTFDARASDSRSRGQLEHLRFTATVCDVVNLQASEYSWIFGELFAFASRWRLLLSSGTQFMQSSPRIGKCVQLLWHVSAEGSSAHRPQLPLVTYLLVWHFASVPPRWLSAVPALLRLCSACSDVRPRRALSDCPAHRPGRPTRG